MISAALTQTEYTRIAMYLGYGDNQARKDFAIVYENLCKENKSYGKLENKKNSIRVRVPSEYLAKHLAQTHENLLKIHELVNKKVKKSTSTKQTNT